MDSVPRMPLLAGGAAGDFSTMSFEERLGVAEIVMDEASGRVPLAFGGQTTSTRELTRLADAASAMGFDFLQVSCPFYFTHTEADFEEFVTAGARRPRMSALIVYNTFWTATNLSFGVVERLARIPNIVGLKWATPRTDAMEFGYMSQFSDRFTIIEQSVLSLIGDHRQALARAFEVHLCNYWPEWGVKLIDEVKRGDYAEIARMMVEEAMPFYKLWTRIEREYTRRRWCLDEALHGAHRAAIEPLPAAHPRYPSALRAAAMMQGQGAAARDR